MAVLSIDAGTTGVTALLVDDAARVIARGYREFPQHFPSDGGGAGAAWVEHDPGEIWSATLEATREALASSPEAPTALGITNQRETVCFWDRETLGSAR
ncbi:MAG: FGGY family carbohydrate kinase, partial [Actinomycetota bacterium]